ncbi:MAG: hypothetical protein M3N98_01500, partial [Actinomycetota bacterium]|nr:hypothetical protein [Actinomycetota bacterium]
GQQAAAAGVEVGHRRSVGLGHRPIIRPGVSGIGPATTVALRPTRTPAGWSVITTRRRLLLRIDVLRARRPRLGRP